MNLKSKVYSLAKLIFGKRPINLTANIVELAPSELLKGRTALITGGTSGIGYAIAEAMLNAGAGLVIITGRTEQRCREAAERLIAAGSNRQNRVRSVVLDNRNVSSFAGIISKLSKEIIHPNQPVSILVNNAGIQGAQFGSAEEEEFDNVMDTNYKGVFFLSQLIARLMVDNKIEGNILNIASSSSLRPAANAYTLSKACIRELTAGMAKTLIPHGIIVNGLAPGPTATPMLVKEDNPNLYIGHNPLGRYALPSEIANMAVILTSGLGRTVVGSIVYMTGGAGVLTYEDVKYPF